jgi:hypothetical protein
MIEENEDLNLETDHLEEVIESPPPAQPVVVIQYRTRGLPWYLVLPLLVLVPLGAVAVYHRVSARANRMFVPPPSVDQSTRKAADRPAGTEALSGASTAAAARDGVPSASNVDLGAPLALNFQPIAPGSLPAVESSPTPTVKPDLTKSASPPAVTPATANETEPAKTAASSDQPIAPPSVTDANAPPPLATPLKEPEPQIAATTPVDATRPAPRGAVAVGFSVPPDSDSPFAELNISRGPSGRSTTDRDRAAASSAPAMVSDPSPDTQPHPTEEQLRQDIQAEAAEKAAAEKQRNDMKDRAREVVDAETQARVEDERAAFRRDLREAVKLSHKEAAAQIDVLCNRYGRNYSEDLRGKARFLLERFGGKMSREDKVRMFRFRGIPEPAILDFLANEIHHYMLRSRNGPRDSDEVRIDAAKQLLRIELVKDAGGASKGLQAQRVRPAASAASNSAPGHDQVP